jgi:hypothetical protein
MKPSEMDKTDLISLCKNACKDNESELNIISEFEPNYASNQAIRWYIRDSPIYRILNKALRTQDINTIFLFQFLIRDLHQQLTECQYQSPIKVYRGVGMVVDEIDRLKESVGTLMAFNGFLSTTLNYDVSLRFVKYCSTDHHPVIFEIDADPEMAKTKPFADVAKYSDFPEESEVLFSVNSLFRITSAQQSSDGLWKIRMTLCCDTDPDLNSLFVEMGEKYGFNEGETAFVAFSRLLREMKKLDEAEKYCHRLLEEFSSNNSSLSVLYLELAEIASEKNDSNLSAQWREKAIEIEKKTQTDTLDNNTETNNNNGKSRYRLFH